MFNPLDILNTFSVFRVAAFGVVATLIGTGGGYIYGRIDGRAIERAEAVAAAEWVRQTDRDTRAEWLEKQQADVEASAKNETANDKVQDALERSEAGDDMPCLSGEWLRGLESLR